MTKSLNTAADVPAAADRCNRNTPAAISEITRQHAATRRNRRPQVNVHYVCGLLNVTLRSQPLYCPPRGSGPGARLDRKQFICACSDWRSCCCFSRRRRCSYWRLQVVVLAGVQPQYCGCQCRGIPSCGARDQQDGSRHCSPKVRSNR